MKALSIYLFIGLSLLASCSSTSNHTEVENSRITTQSSRDTEDDMIETRVVKTDLVPKGKMKIRGLCYIEHNTEREACHNIVIQLVDQKTGEKLETVTDEIGSFSFTPNNRNPKYIEVRSQRFKLKAGKVTVHAGASLSIVIIKK